MHKCHIWVVQANFTGFYVPSGTKPPRAIFLPGHFLLQHQWLSDPEKRASHVCLQTRIIWHNSTESHNQTVWSKSPKSFWRNVLEKTPSLSFPCHDYLLEHPSSGLLPSAPQKGGSGWALASLENGSSVCWRHKIRSVQPGSHTALLSVHFWIACQRRWGPQSTQLLKLLLLQNRNPPQNTQSSDCGE